MVVLKAATDFQMQEITSRCEECLLKRKPTIELLHTADQHKMTTLKDKCINALKNISLTNMDRDRHFQKIEDDTKIELFDAKLIELEDKLPSLPKKQDAFVVLFNELIQMFSDIKTCMQNNGDDASMERQKVLTRATQALQELIKENPENPKAYTALNDDNDNKEDSDSDDD